MILVHWKVKIGTDPRDFSPVYRDGNQQFHLGVSLEHMLDFLALHQEVKREDVIICNVMALPSEIGGTWV